MIFCTMAPLGKFGKLLNLSPLKNNGPSLTIRLECHFDYGVAYWNWALSCYEALLRIWKWDAKSKHYSRIRFFS